MGGMVGEESRELQVGAAGPPVDSSSPSSSPESSRTVIERESLTVLEFAKIVDAVRGLASCPLGRVAVSALRPDLDLASAVRAIEETTEMRRLLESSTRVPLGAARDRGPLLDRLHERGRPLEVAELLEVAATLEASRHVRELLEGLHESNPRLRALAPRLDRFEDLLGEFDRAIDPSGGLRDGASPKLAQLRAERRSVERRLSLEASRLAQSSRLRDHLQSSTVSQRNGRFVLPVRSESRHAIRGILHDRSQSGSTVFIEPEELVESGNELIRLSTEETKEETRILWEMTRSVLAVEASIRIALGALAQIDLAQAKARLSILLEATPPLVSLECPLELWGARHPILALLARKLLESGADPHPLVPIDVRLGGDFHLLVITGPNTGGKTVTLKTVGLLSLMARAGMHVPARAGSRVPLYDLVCADIGDEQSLEQSLSTFSSHVTRLVRILESAGPKTLVLVDELGAGTDPAEGAALSMGVLDFLYRRRVPTLVTTHIGSLKAYAFTHPEAQNASVEFDVQTLSPTYRLTLGLPGQSNAVNISRRLGMPAEVLGRAEATLARERPDAHELIRGLEETRAAAEEARRLAEALRCDMESRKQELEQGLKDVESRKATLSRDADLEIDRVLKLARERFTPLLSQMQNAPQPFDELARQLQDLASGVLRGSPLHEKRLKFIAGLKKDDLVYVPRFRKQGRVKKTDEKRGILTLQIGAMKVDVPFEEIGIEAPGA